ncbi:uncharacterized protein G2W53_016795 [Senna tora]|uniref:Uncharacterized protein n=1 Tax=Senna tora TaxID=362788 RepID=A0A834TRJ6_9FABA|nr:uncharacterized protein G2W53_016795 [Senna tora]
MAELPKTMMDGTLPKNRTKQCNGPRHL